MADELRIQARAEEIYQAREQTGTPGDALGDWLQAEAELAAEIPPVTEQEP